MLCQFCGDRWKYCTLVSKEVPQHKGKVGYKLLKENKIVSGRNLLTLILSSSKGMVHKYISYIWESKFIHRLKASATGNARNYYYLKDMFMTSSAKPFDKITALAVRSSWSVLPRWSWSHCWSSGWISAPPRGSWHNDPCPNKGR